MYQQDDDDDKKYSIVVKSKYDVVLTVTHTCGHTSRYGYGNEEAAQKDVDRMVAKKCVACYSDQQLAFQKHLEAAGRRFY